MRTLKKALCLVLAVVMVLGLGAFSAFAQSSKNYTDANEIANTEAVDVLSALGVLDGKTETEAGTAFEPNATLTRAEGAKIVTALLNVIAPEGAVSGFTDMLNSEWAEPYVAYAVGNGITDGISDEPKQFGPTLQMTGSMFAKWLLVGLGYDPDIEGMTGPSWEIGVAKLVKTVGLDEDIDNFDPSAPMTRDQAAQMGYNALTATMVEYIGGTNVTTSDGTVVHSGGTRRDLANTSTEYRTNEVAGAGLTEGDSTMQLAEYAFKKLKMDDGQGDDMGRESNYWTLDGVKISNESAKEAKLTFVVSKRNQTVQTAIEDKNSRYDLTAWGLTVYLNGDNGATLATSVLVGDVIEVFLDDGSSTVVENIVVTRYSADEVTGDPSTRTEGGVEQVRIPGVVNTYTDIDRVFGYEDMAEDVVAYWYTGKDPDDNTKNTYHIFTASLDDAEGKVTGKTDATTTAPATYTANGVKYTLNANCNPTIDIDTTYELYTDDNGFVVYAKELDDDATIANYYVMVETGIVTADGIDTGKDYIQARLVDMTGKAQVTDIKTIKLWNGTAYVEYKNESVAATPNNYVNGAKNALVGYDASTAPKVNPDVTAAEQATFFTLNGNTLTEVKAGYRNGTTLVATTGIQKNVATIKTAAGNVPADNKTVFIVRKGNNGNNFSKYVGISNVPDQTNASPIAYLTKTNGNVATYVYVGDGNTTGTQGIMFLNAADWTYYSANDGYREYKAIVDGEIKTVQLKANESGLDLGGGAGTVAAPVTGGYYVPSYKNNGIIDKLETSNRGFDGSTTAASFTGTSYKVSGNVIVLSGGTASYQLASNAVKFIKDGDTYSDATSIGSNEKNDSCAVYVALDDDAKKAEWVYVVEAKTLSANASVDEIVDALNENGSATITGDATLNKALTINEGQVLTVEGALKPSGNTITVHGGTLITDTLTGTGTVTVEDKGVLKVGENTYGNGTTTSTVVNGVNLTVTGCTVEIYGAAKIPTLTVGKSSLTSGDERSDVTIKGVLTAATITVAATGDLALEQPLNTNNSPTITVADGGSLEAKDDADGNIAAYLADQTGINGDVTTTKPDGSETTVGSGSTVGTIKIEVDGTYVTKADTTTIKIKKTDYVDDQYQVTINLTTASNAAALTSENVSVNGSNVTAAVSGKVLTLTIADKATENWTATVTVKGAEKAEEAVTGTADVTITEQNTGTDTVTTSGDLPN